MVANIIIIDSAPFCPNFHIASIGVPIGRNWKWGKRAENNNL